MKDERDTLSAPSVGLLLHALRQQGHETDAICEEINLDQHLLQNVNARIKVTQVQQFWDAAVSSTQNPDLALHIGESINPTSMGTIAYVMMNAPTLHEALRKLCRYQDIICSAIQTSLQVNGNEALVKLDVVSPCLQHPRNALDSEMVIYKNAFAALAGQPVPFQQVLFVYPQPESIKEHQRLFAGSELVFDAGYSGCVFDTSYLHLPVVTANSELNHLFEQYAQAYLERLREPGTVRERVELEVARLLKGEEPGIRAVAQRLGMSVRSLQGKLKEEGITYQLVLDEVRKEIAVKHLLDNKSTITDIAYLLGFAEPSAFSRSFKKWTGLPPAQYRQERS